MAPVLAIIVLLIVGGVTVHSLSSGPALAPLERSIDANTLRISDPTSQFSIEYRIGAPTTISGYAFIVDPFQGTTRENGRSLVISYLDARSYKVMLDRYGSIDRCPASFLNQYTKVAQFFVTNAEQHAHVTSLADKSPNQSGAIPFSITGRTLSASTVQLTDGTRRAIDFGPDTLVLVSSVD